MSYERIVMLQTCCHLCARCSRTAKPSQQHLCQIVDPQPRKDDRPKVSVGLEAHPAVGPIVDLEALELPEEMSGAAQH